MKSLFLAPLFVLASLASVVPALAGDVEITLKKGTLRVIGGDAPDTLTFQCTPEGAMTVAPSAGTTINGENGPHPFSFVTRDLIIDLGGNIDVVELIGTFSRDVRIFQGDGDDELQMLGAMLSGDLTIETGRGDDVISVATLAASTDVRVSTGGGNDTLTITGAIGGDLRVSLGAGDDTATLTPLSVTGKKTVNEGAGNDTVN